MAAKRAGFSLLIYIIKQKPVACLAIAGRLRALESYPRVPLLGCLISQVLSHFPDVVSLLYVVTRFVMKTPLHFPL